MRVLFSIIAFAIAIKCIESYNIGVGRSDVTGPSVEIAFMGYASLTQKGHGIHLRQFSRCFIIENPETFELVVFVSVDSAMMSHSIKRDVIKKLEEKFGGLYTTDNVVISGTHTHAGPGGFLTYLMYDLSILGFVKSTFTALVDGIFESIVIAHNSKKPARIFFDETEVLEANINRSPTSYENNPKTERDSYRYNVDKKLIQLRFVDEQNKIFGAFNWFAVHPVSMNNTNLYVSSDNVGYASILLEKEYNPKNLVGTGDFVGAFASTNLGDVSPNIMGPKCEYTQGECDRETSTCPKEEGPCFASGPGKDMFESTKIIGNRIYNGASSLLKRKGGVEITGPLGFIIQNVDMTTQRGIFNSTNGPVLYQGCYPAMGYSFAAGTTDGVGAFDFEQGTTTENPLWDMVRDFLAEPTEEDKRCQHPKPILLAAGRSHFPYEWIPHIVPVQVLRIGSVFIAAVPGELTTMSGRRLRNKISEVVYGSEGIKAEVIIAGLSNLYTSYIATPEEYEIQRYEGASTIFGPHTLTIYMAKYQMLVEALLKGNAIPPGPEEPDLSSKQISLNPPVIFDGHPNGKDFGFVSKEPLDKYNYNDTVEVKFISGNPRTEVLRGISYFEVQQKQLDETWKVVATDAEWETKFMWKRTSILLAHSELTFYWDIPDATPIGAYRIFHRGHYQNLLGSSTPYTGITKEFLIL